MSRYFDAHNKEASYGYHFAKIDKGEYGEFSKITEEFLEAKDSFEQANPVQTLHELSDLLIAIDAYVNKYNMELPDLIEMASATSREYHVRGKEI